MLVIRRRCAELRSGQGEIAQKGSEEVVEMEEGEVRDWRVR